MSSHHRSYHHHHGVRDEPSSASLSTALVSARNCGSSRVGGVADSAASLVGVDDAFVEVKSRILSAMNMKKAADMGLQLSSTAGRRLDVSCDAERHIAPPKPAFVPSGVADHWVTPPSYGLATPLSNTRWKVQRAVDVAHMDPSAVRPLPATPERRVLHAASDALSHASGLTTSKHHGAVGCHTCKHPARPDATGRKLHEALEIEQRAAETRLLELLEEERDMTWRLWEELERVRGQLEAEMAEREQEREEARVDREAAARTHRVLVRKREEDGALLESQRVEIARIRPLEKLSSDLEKRLKKGASEGRGREKAIESLRMEVGRLREMEGACERLWGRCAEEERTSETLGREVAELLEVKEAYYKLRGTLKGSEDRVMEMQGELEKSMARLEGEREMMEGGRRMRREAEEALRAKCMGMTKEVVRLEGEVVRLEGEVVRLRAQSDEVVRLEGEVVRLRAQSEEVVRLRMEAGREVEEVRVRVWGLEGEAAEARARVRELEAEAEEGRARVRELEGEAEEGRARVRELEGKAEEGRRRGEKAEEERGEAVSALREMEREAVEARRELNEREGEYKGVKQELAQREREVLEVRNEAERVKGEVLSTLGLKEQELELVRADRGQIDGELECLKKAAADLEEETARYRELADERGAYCGILAAQLAEVQSKLGEVGGALIESEDEVTRLRAERERGLEIVEGLQGGREDVARGGYGASKVSSERGGEARAVSTADVRCASPSLFQHRGTQ